MSNLFSSLATLEAIAIGQIMLLVLAVTCFTLTWRRMSVYHKAKMQQSVDLMVDQHKVNAMIADAVSKANEQSALTLREQVIATATLVRQQAEDDAADVRQRVVDEAAAVRREVVKEADSVREKVETASTHAQEGFVAGATSVNEKLDVLVNHGADTVNTKLDSLLGAATAPVKVEVVNTPLVTKNVDEKKVKK